MGYFKHGMWQAPEYRIWSSAKQRCFNPASQNFQHYGGRGITMCPEWDASFEAFYAHIGPRPSELYSLDRIDVDGHYEPGNVRWATAAEQRANQRTRAVCLNGLHEMTEQNTVDEKDHRRCRACLMARRTKKERRRQPCGTPAAYQRHYAYGETPCDECREAYGASRRISKIPVSLEIMAYLGAARGLNNPARPDAIHLAREDGRAGCGAVDLDFSSGCPAKEVPDALRCRRSGCREHWAALAGLAG
jgi:hypothetical protein